jgi:hypothetical protein
MGDGSHRLSSRGAGDDMFYTRRERDVHKVVQALMKKVRLMLRGDDLRVLCERRCMEIGSMNCG